MPLLLFKWLIIYTKYTKKFEFNLNSFMLLLLLSSLLKANKVFRTEFMKILTA